MKLGILALLLIGCQPDWVDEKDPNGVEGEVGTSLEEESETDSEDTDENEELISEEDKEEGFAPPLAALKCMRKLCCLCCTALK